MGITRLNRRLSKLEASLEPTIDDLEAIKTWTRLYRSNGLTEDDAKAGAESFVRYCRRRGVKPTIISRLILSTKGYL